MAFFQAIIASPTLDPAQRWGAAFPYHNKQPPRATLSAKDIIMIFLRQLGTNLKVYASLTLLLSMSAALSLWLLAQAGQFDTLAAAATQKLSVLRNVAWPYLLATAGVAALLACWRAGWPPAT
jgi:hypothetical protein